MYMYTSRLAGATCTGGKGNFFCFCVFDQKNQKVEMISRIAITIN